MKLLVLSSRPPWPPVRADQNDVDRLIRFLAGRGHVVDLLCFVPDAVGERRLREGLGEVCRDIATVRLPPWRSYLSTVLSLPGRAPMQVAYFRSPAMRRAVAERVAREGYDLAYTHLIRMAEYSRGLRVPKVLALMVSQALNYGRLVRYAGDPGRRLFYGWELRKVRPYEANVCADFDRVLVGGAADLDSLRRTLPVENVEVCPHGQDIPPGNLLAGALRVPGALVTCGVMATYTNVDAVTWFAREVFPLIERRLPEAAFWIVGRHPRRQVRSLARPPRIVVTGEVSDMVEWLGRASVFVAPMRIAAGQQNKVLQAMACGLPVVATSTANEGIGAVPGREILLRDDPAAFAEACVTLLRDPAARSRLAAAARRFVETHWTWEQHFLRLERILQEVAGLDEPRADVVGGVSPAGVQPAESC